LNDDKVIKKCNKFGECHPYIFGFLCLFGSPVIYVWGFVGSATKSVEAIKPKNK